MKKSLAILLATYNPRINWLIELLQSLNQQSYPNLHLYVRDDASSTISLCELRALLSQYITCFPFDLSRNAQNIGSTQTFAALLLDCKEHYVSFCDQDDVWDIGKTAALVARLESAPLHPLLVCSNVRVIDANGKIISPTIEQHRRRHRFAAGHGLAPSLIYRNFAIGCTVAMERARAVSYLPFPDALLHDHYLAFRAAVDGALDYIAEPQLSYRVYGGNQTGVMRQVDRKQDYKIHRIDRFLRRVRALGKRVELPALDEAEAWGKARQDHFNRIRGSTKRLWRLRRLNLSVSLFELVALRLPSPLFRLSIALIRRGWL